MEDPDSRRGAWMPGARAKSNMGLWQDVIVLVPGLGWFQDSGVRHQVSGVRVIGDIYRG